MTIDFHRITRPLLALYVVLAAIALVLVPAAPLSAQQCTTPASCPAIHGQIDSHWPPQTHVRVYISNAFTSQQQAAIAQAFQNWGPMGAMSNISWSIHYGTPPGSQDYTHYVERAAPVGVPGASAETASPNVGYGAAYTGATTRIDPHVTDLQAMRSITAHEIGHTMGLTDCPNSTCCPGTTVMRGQRPDPSDPTHADYNYSEGMRDTPSECDGETSYESVNNDGGDDEGGGDDTRLRDDGPECWIRIYYSCDIGLTNCVETGRVFLGCW